jgi:Putative MetA-pathway of phenol degradation
VLLGASLKVEAPTGQYDPTKLVNWGTNRWSFKPELGYSQRFGNFFLDSYAGVWFFTQNSDFWSRNPYYPGTRSQSQAPIGAFEGHLSYNFNPRLWASLDGNYWFGGKTSINGVVNPVSQLSNSRIGGTVAFPIGKHQSLKFAYSNGTYIRFGGNYQNVSLAWQYAWVGKRW